MNSNSSSQLEKRIATLEIAETGAPRVWFINTLDSVIKSAGYTANRIYSNISPAEFDKIKFSDEDTVIRILELSEVQV